MATLLFHAAAWGVLLAASVAMLGSFLLLGLRRWPGPSVVAVALCTFPAIFLTTIPAPIVLPLAFAVIGATVRGARVWVWSSVGAGLLLTALLAFTVAEHPSDIVRPLVVMLVLSVLVGLGEAVRNRRDRIVEYRATAVRRRQSEAEKERVRIARELHDVLAHSLSSINVQASVGLHLIDEQPEKAAEALANIKSTSKSALEEVRGVLGVLRSSVDGVDEAAPRMPQPELARLPALVESVSALGVNVTLSGQPPHGLAQLAELTIYRVVQEALTNITRHSTAKNATVAFTDDGHSTLVTVTDDGAHPPGAELVEGRGLLGMQERAALLGGALDSGWLPEGGFRVVLRLPRGGELS
jgi:signal transduction histidine kinase